MVVSPGRCRGWFSERWYTRRTSVVTAPAHSHSDVCVCVFILFVWCQSQQSGQVHKFSHVYSCSKVNCAYLQYMTVCKLSSSWSFRNYQASEPRWRTRSQCLWSFSVLSVNRDTTWRHQRGRERERRRERGRERERERGREGAVIKSLLIKWKCKNISLLLKVLLQQTSRAANKS